MFEVAKRLIESGIRLCCSDTPVVISWQPEEFRILIHCSMANKSKAKPMASLRRQAYIQPVASWPANRQSTKTVRKRHYENIHSAPKQEHWDLCQNGLAWSRRWIMAQVISHCHRGNLGERYFQRYPKGDALRKFTHHALPHLRSWRRVLQPWVSWVRPGNDRASKNRSSQCADKKEWLGIVGAVIDKSEFCNGYVKRNTRIFENNILSIMNELNYTVYRKQTCVDILLACCP